MSLALFLNQDVRGLSYYRTVFYTPAVVSGAAVAMMWLLLLNPEIGVINRILAAVGIPGPAWLFDRQWALPAFIIMIIWGVGGGMVLYLAALQGVPSELYDAAMIDGAGAWPKLWFVTLPMISPVIFFSLVMGIIGSFQVFGGLRFRPLALPRTGCTLHCDAGYDDGAEPRYDDSRLYRFQDAENA